MTPEEIKFMEEDLKKESLNGFARWNWFGTLYHMAITFHKTIEEVGEWDFLLTLTILSYEKEKEIEIKRLNDIQNNKH